MTNDTATPPASPPEGPPKEHTVPPLARRIRGVLLDPVETFRDLDPSWGLVGPWVAVMVAGLVFAVVSLAQVDYSTLAAQRQAYASTFFSEQTKRQMQSAGADTSDTVVKATALMARFALLGGPVIGTILGIVLTGLILFAVATVSGGRKDLLRAIVVAAHAKLVALVAYGALFVGTILGNPTPSTDPHNMVDEVASPVLAAFVSLFDPIAIWHTVLLGIGLVFALDVKPVRATVVAAALYLVPWLVLLGLAAMSLMQRK